MLIDKSKPVLVTGATGYVAGWLIKKLLEEGITVHAAVRDPNNEGKLRPLNKIAAETSGSIKFFKADLLERGSYNEAMQGCELVYHTASPFITLVNDPQKELVDPAVKGTENLLFEANNTESVKRVVLTSSCNAIYTDANETESAPNGELTEEVWNTSASLDYQPYALSKTLAERKAWEINEGQNRWDLVVINPSLVMGPPLNFETTTSESMNLLKQFGDGSLKNGVPDVGIGVVDVRDLAIAHFNAGFLPEAHGRNIISGHNTSFLEMAQVIYDQYGKSYKLSNKALPKWLLFIIGPIVNKNITRRFVRNNVNHAWKANNSKSINELNVIYRDLKTTMLDSFQVLVDNNAIKK